MALGDLSDEACDNLLWLVKLTGAMRELDNAKLCWLLMKTEAWKAGTSETEQAILDEVTTRLYPDFDGEKVQFEEWGWRTPNGDVRYVP